MRRILLVENDPFLQLLYEAELSELGYRVITARDGQTAIKLARRENPDLVIMDVVLPDMEGGEAVYQMKHRRPRVPIVINSMPIDEKVAVSNLPIAEYVTKSSDLTELKNAIRRVFSHRLLSSAVN